MNSRPDDDDARLGEVLRRALARGAAEVHPAGDGLSKIRARTAVARRQRWLVPVAAASSAIVIAGGVALASGAIGPAEDNSANPGPSTSTSATTASPGPIGTTGPTVVPAPTATVPVYYLGAQPRESGIPMYKVFREFRRVPITDPADRDLRVEVAVTEMFANAPLDDDYFGRWPATAAVLDTSVDLETGVVTVDVTGLEWTDVRLPDPDERLVPEVGGALVQQLVYTATAAASKITSDDEFSAGGGVQLLVDGSPVDSLLGVDTQRPVERDPATYQAIIWITDPEWGETVGDPITVRLVANLYEGGPAVWTLSQDGVVIDEGITSTGECCKWIGYEFTIDGIAPGTYELKVLDLGGLGDPDVAAFDSKTINVH